MILCLPALAEKSFASYFVLYLDGAAWRAVFGEAREVFAYLSLESAILERRN
jgi:hypothetical protein